MSIDRTKFIDTTNSSDLKSEDERVDKVSIKKRNKSADYLSIDNGLNRFRCYPPHPDSKSPFIVPKQVWWLPIEQDKRDEKGNPIKDKSGKVVTEIKNKSIFDARIHSSIKYNDVPFDIVAAYVEFLRNKLKDDGYDDATIDEKMIHVYGSYQKKVIGISGKPEFVCYADKILSLNQDDGSIAKKEFGRISFPKAVKMGINDKIAIEESNSPLGTISRNPFTPVDKGRLLLVTYNKEANKATDFYKTDIDTSYDLVTDKLRFYPLSNDDLETFMAYPSLEKMFINVYTKRDFDLSIQGLKNFDIEHKYGILDYEEFLNLISKTRNLYPDKEEKPDVKEDEGENEDGVFDLNTMDRTALKLYIKEKFYPIQVRKAMSDDDIRDAIKMHESSLTEDDEIEDDEIDDEVDDETTTATIETTETEEKPVRRKSGRPSAKDLDEKTKN